MMMRHLLWKDAMAIRPLVVAILIGIVVANVLLGLTSAVTDPVDITTWFASFWILMPNLVALGAPAVLVGSEEESGTLGWLRSLPVRWSAVADSKFLVSVAAVVVAWCASSVVMVLARVTVATSPSPTVQEWISTAGIVYLFTFSLLLLGCGFITAYLFRSPVAGLLAVIPLIVALNWFIATVARALLEQRSYQPDMMAITSQELSVLIVGGIGFVLSAWAIQRLLARRRLTAPDRAALVKKLISDAPVSAYRPPLIVSTTRPPRWRALLWQQNRQMAWLGVALAVIAAFCLMIQQPGGLRSDLMSVVRDLSLPLVWVCVSWLGGLVFYGDNVRRRAIFFADRGISASQVWWTRMLLPGGLCLALIATVWMSDMSRREAQTWIVMTALAFAFGQMVGQWVKRPVLTFFASPVYAAVATIAFFMLLQFYPNYYYVGLIAVPVLLFASWRLTGRWLADRVNAGYHWRVLAYSALSLAIPMALIVSSRIRSTPALDASWRARIAQADPALTERSELVIAPITFGAIGTSTDFDTATPEQHLELLDRELAAESIGEHLYFQEIDALLDQSGFVADERALKSVEILLKWTNLIREDAIDGNLGMDHLEYGAERSEQLAVSWLSAVAGRDRSNEIIRLVNMIPDSEMRRQSRRSALIHEWNQYHNTPWIREDGELNAKSYLDSLVAYSVRFLGFERTRADRYVDELTKLLLQQLDTGLPEYDSDGMRERDRLCAEIIGPRSPGYYPYLPMCRNWTAENEKSVKFVRFIASRR